MTLQAIVVERFADPIDDYTARMTRETDARLLTLLSDLGASGTPECVECGEEIPARRRSAAPWAVRCVSCQSAREREEII